MTAIGDPTEISLNSIHVQSEDPTELDGGNMVERFPKRQHWPGRVKVTV